MKINLLNLFVIVIIAMPAIAVAQVYPDTLKNQNLDEVVVTATKNNVSRNNVAFSVTVVKEEHIEQSSESALLPVLSESVPGLFVTERGVTGFGVAAGSAGQISIRGIGGSPSTQVLVLVNGNPQFMGLMGHPLPDSYVASDAQRVEVIRGPASTLYGSNAMGGVINIITKEQKKEGINVNSRITAGSYNTFKYMVNGGFRKNRLNIFASFNHDRTDGHRDTSEFSISNGYLRAGYELSNSFILNTDFSVAGYKASDPGPDFGKAGNKIDITRGMGAVSLENRHKKSNGSARFFYNFGIHDISDGFHSDDTNYGVILYQSFSYINGNTLTLGFDGKTYGGKARQESISIGDTTVWELAGYAFMQQNFGTKFSLNGGFRLEHHGVYGNEPVPSFGAAWKPTSTTTVKTSISKGFRSPTIRELYLFPPANENLKPERVVSAEASILQKTANNNIHVELTVFRSEGSNLIKTLVNSGKPQNVNTGSFKNMGIELSSRWQIFQSLSFTGNYSYIHMKTPVIATPKLQASSSLNYRLGIFDFSFSAQNIFNLYIKTVPNTLTEDYTLLNTRISCKLSKMFGVFLKLENLLNEKYTINYGYPMPGFLAFGGLNLHL
jgi:iron complex outermembrane receptor protein